MNDWLSWMFPLSRETVGTIVVVFSMSEVIWSVMGIPVIPSWLIVVIRAIVIIGSCHEWYCTLLVSK